MINLLLSEGGDGMGGQSDFYDRQTLYEEVWAEPVYKVAKRYGITDKAIAKVCGKMRIPVPGRGYWNKVGSGQKMKKPALPGFGACPKVRRAFSNPAVAGERKAAPLVPEAFALEERLIQRESLPQMKIAFDPEVRLTNRYALNTERKLNGSKKDISRTYGYGRCGSDNDGSFEVSVGPGSIHRALAILQTLCAALAERGYPIGERPSAGPQHQDGHPKREARPIYAVILDTCISFRITETSNRREIEKKDPYEGFEYEPSGTLCFEILDNPHGSHARSRWQDGKTARVEDRLNDIIVNMIRVATAKKEYGARIKVQRELMEAEGEKRRERERLDRIEQDRIQLLVQETGRMVKLDQIKQYIDVMAAEGRRRLGDAYPGSDFSRWVDWSTMFLEKNSPGTWELPKFQLS